MDALTEYTADLAKVHSFLERYDTLEAQINALKNSNCITVDPESQEPLSDEEIVSIAVGSNIAFAGNKYLKSIHTEIESSRPQWEIDREEEDARLADKEALANEVS